MSIRTARTIEGAHPLKEAGMARISYPDLEAIDDPEVLAILERARVNGTPRPESQAIRSHVPDVVKTFSAMWEQTFVDGVVDHSLKELCRVYVTKTVECGYCAAQRSVDAGTPEEKYDDLLDYATSDQYTEREKAALAYTDAIAWSSEFSSDETWENLHRHFTDPELVELGFFIALTSGQQRWLKTLDIGHGEILADTEAGLGASART
jgi:alkylhydroperoxidase family enzyme